jgi:hypothetical protein
VVKQSTHGVERCALDAFFRSRVILDTTASVATSCEP